jgi:hypothetical protein
MARSDLLEDDHPVGGEVLVSAGNVREGRKHGALAGGGGRVPRR